MYCELYFPQSLSTLMLSDLFDVVSYYNQDQGTKAMAAENKLNAIL